MTEQTDKQSLAFIVATKESLRAEQLVRTWEERVRAIARMNIANTQAKESMALAAQTLS